MSQEEVPLLDEEVFDTTRYGPGVGYGFGDCGYGTHGWGYANEYAYTLGNGGAYGERTDNFASDSDYSLPLSGGGEDGYGVSSSRYTERYGYGYRTLR